ncbi:MAG: quinoprotein relay system zinc metallohydrolase 2 [Pseudomonadota bacterium]
MFEILLTICLGSAPAECRAERLPGGDTLASCREQARLAAADHAAAEQVHDWPCVPAGAAPAFTVTEVAPGVFVHRGAIAEPSPNNRGDTANLGFVIGADSVAVIDTGTTPEIGAALRQAIRAETDLPIRWVILTHMHPDHVLGASAFLADGAAILGHHKLEQALANRAETYREGLGDLLARSYAAGDVVLPTESVADRHTVDLGGRRLDLTAHPTSHTDNDLTVLDRQTGTLFAGDLVFLGHIPAIDGSLLGWLQTLKALSESPAARVVPGHGPAAAPWPEGAQPTATYLADLAEQIRAAIRAGKPMLQTAREIASQRPAGWSLDRLFHARNATAAYKELEWE